MFRKIVKALIPGPVFRLIEPLGHLGEAVLTHLVYGFPSRGLKVIGVTGTNGKTTTCFMIHQMLHQAGYKVGLMTTVGYGVGEEIKPQIQHMTTVSVSLLLKRIKQMRAQGIEWLVLETTSHALAQNRVWGIPYQVAVMTNVTHEHLDYHGTFERYLAAKVKLFKLAQKRVGMGVINADDPAAEQFQKAIGHSLTYGIEQGEIKAMKIEESSQGSNFRVQRGSTDFEVRVQLPGRFNIYNALAAGGTGLALGLTANQISDGIGGLDRVEGRMNTVDEGQDFSVIVDFAHTPDSFEQLLPAVKKITKGRLITVFGSAGRRDEGKRAVQGRIAGQHADVVVVTEEDDRDISGEEIMEQIAAGAMETGKHRDQDLFLIHDRSEAINFAIAQAKSGDTVLLLGKGHEKTIERADGEHPWDEAGEARRALRQRLGKA